MVSNHETDGLGAISAGTASVPASPENCSRFGLPLK